MGKYRAGLDWTVRDEIEAAEYRLIYMCNAVQRGEMQGGGREFERAIDAAFKAIKEHPEFTSLRSGN